MGSNNRQDSKETLRTNILKVYSEALEDDPEVSDQTYTSADTSINSSKLPAIYKLVEFPEGSVVLDYGGGRFDNGIEYLASQGCSGYVYDPYNRSSEYNKKSLDAIRANGGADIVLCSNVLNVIDTETGRSLVLKSLKNYVRSTGHVYITVYEGSKSGQGTVTSKGYQLNRKTADYLQEISEVFPGVTRRGALIIAQ